MNDEKKMKDLRLIVISIDAILIFITIAFQVWAFQVLVNAIMCSLCLLSLSVTLVIDGILKDGKQIAIHGCIYVLWYFNLIMSFFNF